MTAHGRRPFRVVLHGLPYFCTKLRNIIRNDDWEVRFRARLTLPGLLAHAEDARWCDLAYTWGGRVNMGKFLSVARFFGKKKIVILWSGSDVVYARRDFDKGKISPWVTEKVHWAVSPWIADEVRAMGIPCEHVQVSFVPPVEEPPPLPEKFSILMFVPCVAKQDLYGWDRMLEVAEKLRSIEFNLIGLEPGNTLKAPPNVKLHPVVSVPEFLARSTVVYRPVRHDGLSFMVLEALSHGRHVLYSYPWPGCIHVTSVEMACRELQRLQDLHENRTLTLNRAGIEVIQRDYHPDTVQARLLERWKQIILASASGPAPLTQPQLQHPTRHLTSLSSPVRATESDE